MSVRVRFAPSPTGSMHLGNVRTALFDALHARSGDGALVLRIEDTDRSRFQPESLEDIYASLRWLGLTWDEGPDVGGPHAPYVQSQRLDRYAEAAERMLVADRAYRCYCSTERLAALRNSGHVGYDRHCRGLSVEQRRDRDAAGGGSVVRLRVPAEGILAFDDGILGRVDRNAADVTADPVLLKSDGFPTYHLAAVVDDAAMEISHVLRAQEWLPSTPIHLLVQEALGLPRPLYYHLPQVNGPDGRKLGKRHGATAVAEFRARGYLPAAVVNHLALVGWSPGDDRELFSFEELVAAFSLDGINKGAAVFDHAKLDWFNGQHLRRLDDESLADLLRPYLDDAGIDAGDALQPAAALIRERVTVLADAPQWLAFLGDDPRLAVDDLTPKRLNADATARLLSESEPALAEVWLPAAADEAIDGELRRLAARHDAKFGDLMMALRLAITGSKVSPPLFGAMRLLGPDATTRRLHTAVDTLGAAPAAGIE